jgi:predicted DNA-binding transcriptional regulator AlpA
MKKQPPNDKRAEAPTLELKPLAYSVKDFCRAVGISSRMFYSLAAQGNGPTLTRIGRRTLITTAAAEQWLASHQCGRVA